MISKFPLLQKELIEYASRKRTFVLRVLYAIVLYSFFLYDWSKYSSYDFTNVLGSGKYLLETIMIINIGLIFILLPATSASLIISEKEKQTLPLLLVCKIKPSLILLEKYFSSMIPTLTLIIMSFPLIYMCTLLGGVNDARIFRAIYTLVITMLQVTAIGLMFSCYCQSTAQAVVYTYIAGFTLYIFFVFMDLFINVDGYFETLFFAPGIYFDYLRSSNSFIDIVTHTIPVFITIVVFLFLARYFFSTRMHSKKTLVLHAILWQKLKRKTTEKKNVETKSKNLPRYFPIYWRETMNSISVLRYAIFILLLTFLFFFLTEATRFSNRRESSMAFYSFAFSIATLVIIMKSVHSFAKEYKDQTLDVLLTTPTKDYCILGQKILGITRSNFFAIFTVSWFSLLNSIYYFNNKYYYHGRSIFWNTYFFDNLVLIILIMGAAQFLMIWIGLKFKKNNRLALISLAIAAVWCILPIVLYETRVFSYSSRSIVQLFSPVAFFVVTVDRSLPGFSSPNSINAAIFYGKIIFCCLNALFIFLIIKSYQKDIRK